MIELSCVVSAARRCPSPAQPGTSPPSGSELSPAPAAPRAAWPPLCPPLPQSDGAEGARGVPRPAPLGDGRLRQPRRVGGRRRPKAGGGFRRRQMHLQVPEPPDHPHLRLLQAFPGRGREPFCRRPESGCPLGRGVGPERMAGAGAPLGELGGPHSQGMAGTRRRRTGGHGPAAAPSPCGCRPGSPPGGSWGSWHALPWLLAGARHSRSLPPVVSEAGGRAVPPGGRCARPAERRGSRRAPPDCPQVVRFPSPVGKFEPVF